MIRRTLSMLLALVLAAGATACGGGGDDDAADETSEESTESDETTGSDDEGDAETDDEGEAPAEDGEPPASGEPGSVASQLGVDRTFTGEGSEAFCAEMADLQDEAAAGGEAPDDAAFADQMAAITPPAEIADEWTNLYTVQQALADDPSGEALAAMSADERDAWGMSGAVVAAYLGDVCGLDDAG
jgi:hypothetical protein